MEQRPQRDRGALDRLAAELRRRLGSPATLSEWPQISVIVLNRDGLRHLERLLPGLVECTDYPDIELVVIDNASRDDSIEYVRGFDAPFPVSVIENTDNESFSDANNRGAGLTAGGLLLFLNNDTEPFEASWLRELVLCLREREAAAVGPTLIQREPQAQYEFGYSIQQRGLALGSVDGGATLATRFRDHRADPFGESLGVDSEPLAISGACLLVDRGAFSAVGGFTHGYVYGGEDADLSLKLREAGYRLACSGRSYLAHARNSIQETAGEQISEWIRDNRRIFLERWGPKMRRQYELDRLEGDSAPSSSEVEALSYCLVASGANPAVEERLAALDDALLDRCRRRLVLRDDAAGELQRLEYDVVVHLGTLVEPLNADQLNVLWCAEGFEPASAQASRSACDLTVSDPADAASRVIDAIERQARSTGYSTRIGAA